MSTSLTPGRLALIGAVVLVLCPGAAILGLSPRPPYWLYMGATIVGMALLVAGALAKVIQIGVRSAKD